MRALLSIVCVGLLASATPVGSMEISGAAATLGGETVITGPRVRTFYTQPAVYPDATCRRERRALQAHPKGDATPRVVAVEVALALNCRLPQGGIFAHVQPYSRFDEAVAALRRFGTLQAAAAGADPLPFEVTCRTEQLPDSCAAGARAALAALPLHQVFIVQPADAGGWQLAVMPNGPGQLYWNVKWTEDGERRAKQVSLGWEIPAPF